jgi:hypothetical protein
MNKTITIKSNTQKSTAITEIKKLPLEPLHEVVIRKAAEDITARQRRLYWLWQTEIAKCNGTDSEWEHREYKKKYLITIYRRDDPDFESMLQAINNVLKEGHRTDFQRLKEYVLEKTSIMDASKEQMSEYLKLIQVDATMAGVRLTDPELHGMDEKLGGK